MAEPTDLPIFDENDTNTIPISTELQDDGFSLRSKPASGTFNSWFRNVYKWTEWFQEKFGLVDAAIDKLSPVNNYAELRAISYTPRGGQVIDVLGLYNPGDGAGGSFYAILTATLTSTDLANIAIDTQEGIYVSASWGYWKRSYQPNVFYVEWWGALASGVNTVQAQAAFNYATYKNGTLLIEQFCRVETILVSGVNNFVLGGGGAIIGITSTPQAAVIEFLNCTDITVEKGISVSASYNTDYAAGVKIWSQLGIGTSNQCHWDFTIVGAQLAWQFGDLTEPDALLSEHAITGGYCFGCPRTVEAIGTQTVVGFTDYMLNSNWQGGDAAWQTLERCGIRTIGSLVIVTGGEFVQNGDTTLTNQGIDMQPIDSPLYLKNYGKVTCVNVEMEIGCALATTSNPNAIATTGDGWLNLQSCNGFHASNIAPRITTDADFTGEITIGNCKFFAGTPRSQPNIVCNGNANVYVDNYSFGTNFPQGLDGIEGGILHFKDRLIMSASRPASQVVTGSSAITVIYATQVVTGDAKKFKDNYDDATGIFTVPDGGLKLVHVRAQLFASSLSGAYLSIYVNGSPLSLAFLNKAGNVDWSFDELSGGTTIDIRISPNGTDTLSGATNAFMISGSN